MHAFNVRFSTDKVLKRELNSFIYNNNEYPPLEIICIFYTNHGRRENCNSFKDQTSSNKFSY